MASTKKQQGTTNDVPFATPSGRTKSPDPTPTKPTDLVRDPRGNPAGRVYPGKNFIAQSTSQEAQPAPPDPMAEVRRQTPVTAAERCDPASIPRGGVVTKADPGAASRSDGAEALGSERRPFKLKG